MLSIPKTSSLLTLRTPTTPENKLCALVARADMRPNETVIAYTDPRGEPWTMEYFDGDLYAFKGHDTL